LISLSRDIERQVLAINHTLDEPQVTWEELLTVGLDQDLPGVEMDLGLILWHSHLLAVAAWHVEQGLDCQGHISRVVQLILEGDLRVGDLLIEALVLIHSHITLLTIPNGGQRIHLLSIEPYWVANKLREFLDNFLNFIFLGIFSAVGSQFNHDLGASLKI
jgi:hypothetical protein